MASDIRAANIFSCNVLQSHLSSGEHRIKSFDLKTEKLKIPNLLKIEIDSSRGRAGGVFGVGNNGGLESKKLKPYTYILFIAILYI